MIIIGTGLAFTLFIIGLCFYGVILGALLFLFATILPLAFIVGCPLGLYWKYKDYKNGKITSFSKYNYVCVLIEIGIGILCFIKISIPILECF